MMLSRTEKQGFTLIFGSLLMGLLILIMAMFLTLALGRQPRRNPSIQPVLIEGGRFVEQDSQQTQAIQAVDSRALIETSFDTGFRAGLDGFHFRNYGSRYAKGNLTIVEARELFGDQVCIMIQEEECIPTPAAQLWIDQMNAAMTSGHCVGFTVMANNFYIDQLNPADFSPNAVMPIDVIQDAPVMRKIAQAWVLQVTEELLDAIVLGTPRDIVDRLYALEQPVDLGVLGRSGGGHSMLGYGVSYQGDGIYHILVYDNNWPEQELYVEVDYYANTWRYSLGANNPTEDPDAWEGDVRSRSLLFIPLEAYLQPVTCPFCEKDSTSATDARGVLAAPVQETQGSGYTIISVSNDESQLQASNEQGQRLGHFGDEFITEIPDAQLVRVRGMFNDSEPLLTLPADTTLSMQVYPRPDERSATTDLRIIGPGASMAIDNIVMRQGEQDDVFASTDDWQLNYTSSGERTPTFKLAMEHDGVTYMFILGGADFAAGQGLNLDVNPGSGQLNIGGSNLGTSRFKLLVGRLDGESMFVFATDSLIITEGGAAALDFAVWDGQGSMEVLLDTTGDGTFDQSQSIEGQPIDTILSTMHSSRDVITSLSEIILYSDQQDIDGIRDILGTLDMDGSDIGEILSAFIERIDLTAEEIADLIDELDLPIDEIAELLFELDLDEEEFVEIIEELELSPEELNELNESLDSLEQVDDILDEIEFNNVGDEEIGEFLQDYDLDVDQLGDLLDELELEPEELAKILDDLGLSPEDIAAILDDINLGTEELVDTLEEIDLSEEEIVDVVQDMELTDEEEAQVLSELESSGVIPTSTPTPTPTPVPTLIPTPTPTVIATTTLIPTQTPEPPSQPPQPPASTDTPAPTPTNTRTPTPTPTNTNTPTPTPTNTPTPTSTPTDTPTPTPTPTFTPTPLPSGFFIDSGQLLGSTTSRSVSLTDVDGDGDRDAIIANNGTNKVWLNDGNATFTDSGQALGNSDSQGIALGDIDGDGDLDIFISNSGPNKVWQSNGSGTFTDSGQNLGNFDDRGVALGDLDGDSDLDAFVAGWGQGNRVWLNDGSGTFTNSGQNLGTSPSISVALGDVDGDGDLDAFVTNWGQANRLWLNNGGGIFTDSGQAMGSLASYGVALRDVDGNGSLDAFVANDGGQANRIWLNSGGIFSDSGQSLGNFTSRGVALRDIDGDGDQDAFIANGGANKVWKNGGSGAFSDTGQNLGSAASYSVVLEDLNGDSYVDAFVANNGANTVWINQ
ncbi:MAG: hypothetical protein GY832_13325 [Chloroflexi bacterium]|nr:hypothetical protein [Chloroflexota bacterium]